MSELLQAAKAVIERWDNPEIREDYWVFCDVINDLRAAVERAEPESKPGLDQLLDLIRFLEQQIEERKNQ